MASIVRLPGPAADQWDWQLRAACRGMDGAVFFHPWNERGPARQEREERAKAVCAACPVVQSCAAHALTVKEAYGVWGGLTEHERQSMLGREQRRGWAAAGAGGAPAP